MHQDTVSSVLGSSTSLYLRAQPASMLTTRWPRERRTVLGLLPACIC